MKITTTCTASKSIAIKCEKVTDEAERIIAHLKITDLFVDREQINRLCGQTPGWCEPLQCDLLKDMAA